MKVEAPLLPVIFALSAGIRCFAGGVPAAQLAVCYRVFYGEGLLQVLFRFGIHHLIRYVPDDA